MKFAVFSLMQWPDDRSQEQVYQNELEQLTIADTQGYDAAWLAEHHFSRYGIGPSIHLTAAHLAARTERIRIGTAVTVLPFFHPLRLAEEIAMLDIMSGGRFDWGVGRGYQAHEFAGFASDAGTFATVSRTDVSIWNLERLEIGQTWQATIPRSVADLWFSHTISQSNDLPEAEIAAWDSVWMGEMGVTRADYAPSLHDARLSPDGSRIAVVVEPSVLLHSPDGELLSSALIGATGWSAASGDYVYSLGVDPETEEEVLRRYRLVLPGER